MSRPYKRKHYQKYVPNKKFKKAVKPKVPYKPRNLRAGYKKVARVNNRMMKIGGVTQCGTGHWKSYGRGPTGSRKVKGFLGKMAKLLPPQIQLTDDKFQISCASAVQNMAIVSNIYSPYDLYNFNGGQLQATSYIAQNKVVLKDYSVIIAFTNQTNANIKVTLYDIIQRRDVISHQPVGTLVETPLAAWQKETTLSTSYASTNTAAVPFDSEVFCRFYKVIKSTDYRLAQGETGEHFINGKMNKIWDHTVEFGTSIHDTVAADQGKPADISRYKGGYKGLTHWTLAVVQGFPTDNDNSTVTTSIAEVDFVTTTRYSFNQVTTQNSVATSATNIAAAAGHSMNQGSGADTLIANA